MALKTQADFTYSMARLHYRQWLDLHRRLFLLKQCEVTKVFANYSLQVNALILKDLRCKPLREPLQDVLRLQRQLAQEGKEMREWGAKSKKLDHRFWEMRL